MEDFDVMQPTLLANAENKLSKEEQDAILAVMQRAKTFEEQEVMRQSSEGWLLKYTNVVKGWQNRWFVLDFQNGVLTYYLNEDKRKQNYPRGSLQLSGSIIAPSDEDSQTFGIHAASGEVYKVKAGDAKERQVWILRLRCCTEYHTKKIALPFRQNTLTTRATVSQSQETTTAPVLNETPKVPSAHKSVPISSPAANPADNVVTKSIQSIGSRIGSRIGYSPSFRSKERHSIPSTLNKRKQTEFDQIDDLKACINTAQLQHSSFRDRLQECPLSGGILNLTDDIVLLLSATSTATLDALNECAKLIQMRLAEFQQLAGIPVGSTVQWYTPQGSKSMTDNSAVASKEKASIGDMAKKKLFTETSKVDRQDVTTATEEAENSNTEDDSALFHMAPESLDNSDFTTMKGDNNNTHAIDKEVVVQSQQPMQLLPVKVISEHTDSTPLIAYNDADETFDEDDVYDSEDDEAEDTKEEHKSVILHLLGQMRLGMDLTKVALPTFVLERRSLLEMYADYFSHPDLFLRIADGRTPEERMLYVVEWYLTSFHKGKKGSVAKKPYNPIIGETFHCSWDVNNNLDNELKDTPQSERLTFVAEQVSHHPPISGFYAECESKRICLNAHVWTKSKFLGMSIGVSNVGEVILSLLDYEEDYIFTLPSAYCRSILTVPWIELGGKLTVDCAATKYTANITFHTKPFYGGKINRISGEIKDETSRILYKINGEWNDIIEITEVANNARVIDTRKLKSIRKKVKPLTSQGEFESRKLWRHVTVALKNGDIDSATKHKRMLEDRQRKEARQRKDENKAWEAKIGLNELQYSEGTIIQGLNLLEILNDLNS